MFGAEPLGDGLFGATTETVTEPYEPAPPPAAIFFDAGTRDATLDADGRYEEMDPDDQQVALSFAVARGTVKHAPEVGHDFLELLDVPPSKLQATAERMAAEASPFDSLLAARRVELLGVEVRVPKRGEVRTIIKYRKLGERQVRTADVGTG